MMEPLKPYEGYLVNPALEMMGLTAYIGLAQTFQRLAEAVEQGSGLSPNEASEMLDVVCLALTYLVTGGIVDRHPDLAAIPEEVAPHDFKGGDEGGLVEWFAEELAGCVKGEKQKVTHLLN